MNKPFVGKSVGELLWLENPGGADALSQAPWHEHVLTQGPEVVFEVAELLPGDQFQVFAAQFFSAQAVTLCVREESWRARAAPHSPRAHPRRYNFNSTTLTLTAPPRVIEKAAGAMEDVYLADLDADGTPELVASSHVGGGGGAVYAYELPADLLRGAYVRHTLAGPFPVTEKGPEQASPGFSFPVFPRPGDTTTRPSILLAGDGSQSACVWGGAVPWGCPPGLLQLMNSGGWADEAGTCLRRSRTRRLPSTRRSSSRLAASLARWASATSTATAGPTFTSRTTTKACYTPSAFAARR